jgi:HEPN domain-containing protein
MEENGSYLDFAENDYQYLHNSYVRGDIANHMCAMAQEICEKYMKHIIETHIKPQTSEEVYLKQSMLKTHNLNKIINYLDDTLAINYSDDARMSMLAINGFYFSTRYPGDDSFMATKKDVELGHKAATICREETLKLDRDLTNNVADT